MIFFGEFIFILNENICMKIEKLICEMRVKVIVLCVCFLILMWNVDYMEIEF